MILADAGRVDLLRTPSNRPGDESEITIAEEEAGEQAPEEEAYILCRQCHRADG